MTGKKLKTYCESFGQLFRAGVKRIAQDQKRALSFAATLTVLLLLAGGYFATGSVPVSDDSSGYSTQTARNTERSNSVSPSVPSQIMAQLRSPDRYDRQLAAEELVDSERPQVAALAKVLLYEIRKSEPSTEALIEQLLSSDHNESVEAEKALRMKGDEAVDALIVALREQAKKLGASALNQRRHYSSELKVSELSVSELIDELKNCIPEEKCAAATQLLKIGGSAKNSLIQALLNPDPNVKAFARMILVQKSVQKKRAPLFHSHHFSTRAQMPVEENDTEDSGSVMDIQPLSLEGTRWTGVDSDGEEMSVEFLGRGALTYSDGDAVVSDAKWTQDGELVTLRLNDGFAVYQGTREGDSISGTAKNRAGKEWTWKIERE